MYKRNIVTRVCVCDCMYVHMLQITDWSESSPVVYMTSTFLRVQHVDLSHKILSPPSTTHLSIEQIHINHYYHIPS